MNKVCSILLATALFPSLSVASTLTGSWTNTTFNSTGAVTIDISTPLPTITITADFDGGVFGFGDPPPLTVAGMVDMSGVANLSVMDHVFFGDVSGTLDSSMGTLDFAVTNLPLTGPTPTGFDIFSASLSGSLTSDSMFNITAVDINYLVIFNCGGATPVACGSPGAGVEAIDYALGVIHATAATVVPLPAGLWLFGTALAGMLGCSRLRSKV